METNNNEFQTRDINEAAACLAVGLKLIRLEEGNGFYWFIIGSNKGQEVCNQFWAGELTVDAKKFSDALRGLKDRLFARK